MLSRLSYSGCGGNARKPAEGKLGGLARTLRVCVRLAAAFCGLAPHLQAGFAQESGLSPSAAREFAVKGVIRKLEPETGHVVIAHEAIPGFMEAMTMPFQAKKPSILTGLQAGDSIAFRLFVDEEKSWIETVVKIPPLTSEPPATDQKPAQAPTSIGATLKRPRAGFGTWLARRRTITFYR